MLFLSKERINYAVTAEIARDKLGAEARYENGGIVSYRTAIKIVPLKIIKRSVPAMNRRC